MELYKSPVVFDQLAHTYTLGGMRLAGITTMLSRQLFPCKYDGVPQSVLEAAAARGSYVHEVCEIIDSLGVLHDSAEAKAYVRLKGEWGLQHLASEYLVSDEEHFASSIDKVYVDGEDTVTLADIKTTAHLDEDYVGWQLSVYAYLFERQNPGIKAARLLAVWLRPDTARITEVERIPDGVVAQLLSCEAEGRQFDSPLPVRAEYAGLPAKYREMEGRILEIERMAKYWAEQKRQLTDGVLAEMLEAGVSKWTGEKVAFTRKEDTVREGFDLKRFRAEHPGLYDQYRYQTQVKGSVILKEI